MAINIYLSALTGVCVFLGVVFTALRFRRQDASDAVSTAKNNVEAMAVVADEHREDMALLRVELLGAREELARKQLRINELEGRNAELEALLKEARGAP